MRYVLEPWRDHHAMRVTDRYDPESEALRADEYRRGLRQEAARKTANIAGVFTNIPGAASRTFTFSPVKLTDDSASFRVQVANAFGNATSGAATLTVTRDTTAPTITDALTRGNPNGLFVVFSEQVTAVTATNKNNYTINNGVTVNGASLQADGLTVLLTTTAIASGRGYLLTVSGVQDTAAVPNTIAANCT